MYKAIIDIEGVDISVTNTCAASIVSDIKNMFNMAPDVKTTIGDSMKQDNETPNLDDNTPHASAYAERLKVEVTQSFNDDTAIRNRIHQRDYPPFIYDPNHSLLCKPVYLDTDLLLTIRYESKSKTNMDKVLNKLKRNAVQDNLQHLHNIEYSFILPRSIWYLVAVINDLRNIGKDIINAESGVVTKVTVLDSTTYTVNINGVDYTYLSGIGATVTTILTGLKAAIDADVASVVNVELRVDTLILTTKTEGINFALTKQDNLYVGASLEDYMLKTCDERVTVTNGVSGLAIKSEIAIKETQLDVLGFFTDDVGTIKTEYDKDSSVWYIDLEYKVTFNKPTSLYLEYSPIVYNQLLPLQYIIKTSTVGNKNIPTKTRTYLADIEKQFTTVDRLDRDVLTIPEFDSYNKFFRPRPFSVRAFTVLVGISPTDRRSLLNLADLIDHQFTPEVLSILTASEYQYLQAEYESIFYIELFGNDNLMDNSLLTVDANLNVSYLEDLPLDREYRITFNVVNELFALNGRMLNVLQTVPNIIPAVRTLLTLTTTGIEKGLAPFKPIELKLGDDILYVGTSLT